MATVLLVVFSEKRKARNLPAHKTPTADGIIFRFSVRLTLIDEFNAGIDVGGHRSHKSQLQMLFSIALTVQPVLQTSS